MSALSMTLGRKAAHGVLQVPRLCHTALVAPGEGSVSEQLQIQSHRLTALGAAVCVPRLVLGQLIQERKLWARGQHKQSHSTEPHGAQMEWGGGHWAMHVLQSSSPSPLAVLSEAPAFHLG